MNINCPICGNQSRLIFPGEVILDRHCDVLRCSVCAQVFLNNKMRADEGAYWQRQGQEEAYFHESVNEEFRKKFTGHLARLERYAEGRKLLDIGCGTGLFMETAKARGWQCFGLDISSKAAKIASRRLNLSVAQGVLEDSLFSGESFDLITMWDVIEHLIDPARAVKEAYRRLKDGGILLIETPDDDFLLRRVAKILFKFSRSRAAFLPKYFYYQDHLFYFSAKTLSNLLKKSGPFDVIKVGHLSTGSLFSREKLKLSCPHSPKILYRAAPGLAGAFSLLRLGNKLIVYAKKISAAPGEQRAV